MNGKRVAIERDYVTQFYVRRLYPETLVIDHPDTASALRAVALGEDDFYFGSLLMAMDRLQRDRIPGLAVKRSLVYATGLMHFGVRNDWPLLASALSKGVAALRQTPMPALQDALGGLAGQPVALPGALPTNAKEQAQLASRSVLRVGAVRGLSLLNEATAGGGHSGIAADYLSQVATRLGVAVDVLPFDSVAQMLDALRDGQIHLVPLLTRTPERAKQFSFSDPCLERPHHVIARSDAPMYWDLASLRGKRLALTAQHPLREFLAARCPEIVIIDAPPGEGAMDRVVAGQADAAVEAKLFANLRINTDNNGVRWVAVQVNPGFAWRRHLPWLATAALALLLMLGLSLAWMRRLAREVQARGRVESRLHKIANSLPGVVLPTDVGADVRVVAQYLSASAETFLGPGALAERDVVGWVARRLRAWPRAHRSSRPSATTIRSWACAGCMARWWRGARRRAAWSGPATRWMSRASANCRPACKRRCRPRICSWPAPATSCGCRCRSSCWRPAPPGPGAAGRHPAAQLATGAAGVRCGAAPDRRCAGPGPLRGRPGAAAIGQRDPGAHAHPAGGATPPGRRCPRPGPGAGAAARPARAGPVRRPAAAPVAGQPDRRCPQIHPPGRRDPDGRATGPARRGRRRRPGLAICKRLVQAMQGEIMVLSQPGQGTEVRVHLPLVAPLAAAAQAPVPDRPGAVLLVDDDEISLMLMAEMLRRAGWAVLQAASAEAALPLWRRHGVAAVVSDRFMPGLDGPTLLRLIGQEAADGGRTCPARLLCSGDAAPEGGLPEGVDAVPSKPVSAAVLMDLLAALGVRPAAAGAGLPGAEAAAGPG